MQHPSQNARYACGHIAINQSIRKSSGQDGDELVVDGGVVVSGDAPASARSCSSGEGVD